MARAHPTGATLEKDEQVAHILGLMASGKYHGARTNAELMAQWGLTVDQLKHRARLASYAMRMMRREGMDEWLEAKMAELDAIKTEALARKRSHVTMGGDVVEYADPDFRSALMAIDMQMKCHLPVAKHSGRGQHAVPGESVYAKLSAEERIAAHRAAIDAEEARLKESHH